jgi:hypothetical protein
MARDHDGLQLLPGLQVSCGIGVLLFVGHQPTKGLYLKHGSHWVLLLLLLITLGKYTLLPQLIPLLLLQLLHVLQFLVQQQLLLLRGQTHNAIGLRLLKGTGQPVIRVGLHEEVHHTLAHGLILNSPDGAYVLLKPLSPLLQTLLLVRPLPRLLLPQMSLLLLLLLP